MACRLRIHARIAPSPWPGLHYAAPSRLPARPPPQVDALVDEEARRSTKRPADYLHELPPPPTLSFANHPLLAAEYERWGPPAWGHAHAMRRPGTAAGLRHAACGAVQQGAVPPPRTRPHLLQGQGQAAHEAAGHQPLPPGPAAPEQAERPQRVAGRAGQRARAAGAPVPAHHEPGDAAQVWRQGAGSAACGGAAGSTARRSRRRLHPGERPRPQLRHAPPHADMARTEPDERGGAQGAGGGGGGHAPARERAEPGAQAVADSGR